MESEKFEDLAHQLIDALPSKLADASLQHLAISLGIAIDKMLLLRGQPNQITSPADKTTEEKRAEVRRWLTEQGMLESDHENH